MTAAWTFTQDQEGIGRLLLNVPEQTVNTLSSAVVKELQTQLEYIAKLPTLKALALLSGKKNNFIAGADVKEFTTIHDSAQAVQMAHLGQAAFNQLARMPFPTIAVIDGSCMGGGLELALACSYRIVVDEEKTLLALPEVNLGLIPGWGGTQRLTKLVGLIQALEMILTGKSIPARKAMKIGLADAIAPRAFVEQKLREFVNGCLNETTRKQILGRRRQGSVSRYLFENNPLGRYFVFRQSEQQVRKKTKNFYPAPLAALNVIKSTQGMPMEQGLAIEANTISSLFEDPVARNLIRLFVNGQELKKQQQNDIKVQTISSVAVLGAGVMGGAIAWLFSKDDYPVRLKDINWDAISKGMASAHAIYGQLVKIKKLTKEQLGVKMHHISGTTDYTGFKHADLVIEAIVEDLKIKQKVLSDVERVVAPQTVIATNTSALSVTEMSHALKHPERFLGMHFFNPVNRMPLVEIIPTDKTAPEVVAAAVALMKKIGKTPIVVKDAPGFLVNRILLPYLNEAGWLLEDGIDYPYIDQLMTRFGMPMGPFQLLDEIGFDIAYKAAITLAHAFGKRAEVPDVFQLLVEKELVGKKGKGGFYAGQKKQKKNSAMRELLYSQHYAKKRISDEDIVDRLILGMVNEASRCLEEKIVANAETLDLAMIMGAGFPPFRGGVIRYAEERGFEQVLERLHYLQHTYGERFNPSNTIRTCEVNV